MRIILGSRAIFVGGVQWDHLAVGVGEMDDVEIPVKWPLFWFEVYDKGEKHGYICLNNGCPCIRTGPGQPDFGIKSRTGPHSVITPKHSSSWGSGGGAGLRGVA